MLYADFNYITSENITYTVDMIRIRCDITNEIFSLLETRIKTIYHDLVKNHYLSLGISDFKYNYNIEVKEGVSYWFGFIHNSELVNKSGSLLNENTTFNFTVEFNPNKVPVRGLLLYIVKMCLKYSPTVKSVDLAMDIPVNILDIGGFDKGRKKDFRMFTQGRR